MFNTKCGCPYCRGIRVPTTKWGWKGLKNKRGRMYGTKKNPRGKKPHQKH